MNGLKVSTKGRYGLIAMIDIAAHQSSGSVSLKSVALRNELPESYLEHLICALRKAGLVKSTRGAFGGYVLAKPPSAISMGDVLRVLEGPLSPVGCLVSDGHVPTHACEKCVTRPVWQRMYSTVNNILDNTLLEDLANDYLCAINKACAIHKEDTTCQE